MLVIEAVASKFASPRGKNTYDKIDWAFGDYFGDMDYCISSMSTVKDDATGAMKIDGLYFVIKDEEKTADKVKMLVNKFKFKVGLKDIHTPSSFLSKDKLPFGLNDEKEIVNFLKFLNSETGKLKGCISYK